MTELERIRALEVRMATLTEDIKSIDTKLDSLLNLRQRGIGAFWLASSLFGTTLLGALSYLFNWKLHV